MSGAALPQGTRRPPAFKPGDTAGVFEIIEPGDPAAYSTKRKVTVRCTCCRYTCKVYESWLRWLRDGRVASSGSCSMCRFGLLEKA